MMKTRAMRSMNWPVGLALIVMISVGGGMSGGNCAPTDDTGNPAGNPIPSDPPAQQGNSSGGSSNKPPTLSFQWPTAPVSIQNGSIVTLRWRAGDPEDVTRVSIIARPESGGDIVLVAGKEINPPEGTDSFVWNTSSFREGTYEIIGRVSDSKNPEVTVTAPGKITIQPRTPGTPPVPPPPPTPNKVPTLTIRKPIVDANVEVGIPVEVQVTAGDPEGPAIDLVVIIDPVVDPDVEGDEITIINETILFADVGANSLDRSANFIPSSPGQYKVIATVDDKSGIAGHKITVEGSAIINVIDEGTGVENGAPTLQVALPVTDAGLSDGDAIVIAGFVSDPNSDIDDLTITYFLDRDLNPTNDDSIEIGNEQIPAPNQPGAQLFYQLIIPELNVNEIPVRELVDEGGRPLPYNVRIRAEDGKGGVTNKYAPGSFRILGGANDVVDLANLGGSVAGARMIGFYGNPIDESRGSRAGTAFAALGDFNSFADASADFAIAARTASPLGRPGVGTVHLIYGRPRFGGQGRYSGTIQLNQVGTFQAFPPTDPNFQTLFNIQGTQMYHPAVGMGGTSGIVELASITDVTGDGLPELLIGVSQADSVADTEDNDPCDLCEDPNGPELTCFTDLEVTDPQTFDIPLALFFVPDPSPANAWLPFPPGPVSFDPVVDLGLGDTLHILQMVQFRISFSGTAGNVVRNVNFEPASMERARDVRELVTFFGGGLVDPRDFKIGPNGDIFVVSSHAKQVLQFDGGDASIVGEFTTGTTLIDPTFMTFGPDGNLYVSDAGTADRVARYDGTTGAFLGDFVTTASGGLNDPNGLAFGPDGNLYVSSFATDRILRYDGITGAFIDVFVLPNQVAPGLLDGPTGLVFNDDGTSLFVSSKLTNTIRRYDFPISTTGELFAIAGDGINGPMGLVFGPNGNLFIANEGNDSVTQLDGISGNPVLPPIVPPGDNGLDGPYGVIFDDGGFLIVSGQISELLLGYDLDIGFAGDIELGRERQVPGNGDPCRASGRWGIDVDGLGNDVLFIVVDPDVICLQFSAFVTFNGMFSTGAQVIAIDINGEQIGDPIEVNAATTFNAAANRVTIPAENQDAPIAFVAIVPTGGTGHGPAVCVDDIQLTVVEPIDATIAIDDESQQWTFPLQLNPDGTINEDFGFDVPLGGIPYDENGGPLLPPSVYDGLFDLSAMFTGQIEGLGITITWRAVTGTDEEHQWGFAYLNGQFPDATANLEGCGNQDPAPINPFTAGNLEPACAAFSTGGLIAPAMGIGGLHANDDNISNQGLSGFICAAMPLGGAEGPTDDDLFDPANDPAYVSGLTYLAGSDQLIQFQNGNGTWNGPRVQDIGQFGQEGGIVGARFRGSWVQMDPPNAGGPWYDPNSRSGTTIDSLPDYNFSPNGLPELVISSPGGGRAVAGGADLSAVMAGDWTPGETRLFSYTELLDGDGVPLAFDDGRFSRVLGATITLDCVASRGTRLTVQFIDGMGNPVTLPTTTSFWVGDSPAIGVRPGDIEFTEYVPSPFPLPMPININLSNGGTPGGLDALRSLNLQNAGLFLRVTMEADCAIINSTLSVNEMALTVSGLEPNVGQVVVYDGSDWTTPSFNDADQTTQSWPGFTCDIPNRARPFVNPPFVTMLTGQNHDDFFGWAKHAGDVNRDSVPDIACGSPGSDNDPNDFIFNSNPLNNNGMAYVVFGSPTPDPGPVNPTVGTLERLELRGTHNNDGFGRVQGILSDFTGDPDDDAYFAAEGYDFDGVLPAWATRGYTETLTDAGFVAVLSGFPEGTGEATLRPEQIGSLGNPFEGVKFVGGQAGARLGQTVATAGDFNRDGAFDMLITAPGQNWPAGRVIFAGPVADGETVTVNGVVFEFDTSPTDAPTIQPGRTRVDVSGEASDGTAMILAQNAEGALRRAMRTVERDVLNITTIQSQKDFPDPDPDVPTLRFLHRKATGFELSTTAVAIQVVKTTRRGVTYLIFGDDELADPTVDRTFVLPDDLNKRDAQGKRLLKGIVFVSPYQPNDLGDVSNPFAFVNFESVNPADVAKFATFTGGVIEDVTTTLMLAAPAPLTGTNAYVVDTGAQVEFLNRPVCTIVSAYFVFDPSTGATGATMRAFSATGQLVGTRNAFDGSVPPPMNNPNNYVVAMSSNAGIARIEIVVTGPAGSKAVLDNVRVNDPTPDEAPMEAALGVGDVDGDTFPDIILGAPHADFINIIEPCQRRQAAGEVYLIYGNKLGLNDPIAP